MPLYALGPQAHRVYHSLRDRITSGELPPGAQLASQRALAADYRVSPMTARLAVSQLEDEGLLVRKRRRGTFVLAPNTDEVSGRSTQGTPRGNASSQLPDGEEVRQGTAELKRADTALREAEARYRALLDGAPIGISLADLEGNLIVVNAAFQRLVGYNEEELRRMRFAELTHPDDLEADVALFEQTIAGRRDGYELEKRYIRKDGRVIWVHLTVVVPRDEDGNPTYDIAMLEDITERKRMEQVLRASQEHYRLLLETSPDAIAVTDTAGRVVIANEQAAHLCGFDRVEDLFGVDPLTLLVPRERRSAIVALRRLMISGKRQTLVHRLVRRDGSAIVVEVAARVMPDEDGLPQAVVAVARDITERTTLEQRLRHQALHDDLTDLPNRAHLSDRAAEAMGRADRDGRPLALLLVNLIRFKLINDTFGHSYGDLVLNEVGARLGRLVRKSDTVARLGGDEFAILLEGADVADACTVARAVRRGLEEPYIVQGHSLYLAARCGIAIYPEHGADVQTLLQHADVAMHLAKQYGEPLRVYEAAQDQHALSTLTLAADLRRAVDGDGLMLHYQPKIDLDDGRVCGVEALARWHHPARGWVPPSRFIELAENSGLIAPLTVWLLNAALSQCAAWRRQGKTVNVAVNLSARNLHDLGLADTIARCLKQRAIDPSLLTLEITETSFMLNPAVSMELVRRLHDMGIRIAIDDFGTGYSSLAYLNRLPVDEIKIDRAFISGIKEGEAGSAIVSAVVDLGHTMGVRVVAEGIETEAALDAVRALGCDVGQGFAFAQPLPQQDVIDWIETWDARQSMQGRKSLFAGPRPSPEEAADRRYEELIENANDMLYTTDLDGYFTSLNRAGERLTGYTRKEAARMKIMDVLTPASRETARAMTERKLQGEMSTTYEVEMVTKDGRLLPLEMSTRLILDGDEPVGIQGIGRDMTDRKKAEEALKYQAQHDALTGLPNRVLLHDRLQQALAQAQRRGEVVAVLFIDLDGFKQVNDRLGHEAGDTVLRSVAQRLQSAVRASDTVARLAGDEFVVVLSNVGSAESAAAVTRSVLSRVLEAMPVARTEISMGASIGVALYPSDAVNAETLLHLADDAMYRAKSAGGRTYALYLGPIGETAGFASGLASHGTGA